jgi:hypothetical protein
MADLKGRIWTRTIDRHELDGVKAVHEVISTRLSGGRTVVHVLSDTAPGAAYSPVEGGLEDVYFSTLAASRRAA